MDSPNAYDPLNGQAGTFLDNHGPDKFKEEVQKCMRGGHYWEMDFPNMYAKK